GAEAILPRQGMEAQQGDGGGGCPRGDGVVVGGADPMGEVVAGGEVEDPLLLVPEALDQLGGQLGGDLEVAALSARLEELDQPLAERRPIVEEGPLLPLTLPPDPMELAVAIEAIEDEV